MDKRFTLFRIFRREANAVRNSKAQTIKAVCDNLLAGDAQAAGAIARNDYPFAPPQSTGRAYTEAECTTIFIRDGFIDRYSGTQLVFPGTLRLLSRLLPSDFPFHRNWKMTETHMVYWELFPTVDHIVPIARGGAHDETNWATTSMLRNSAKSNWTLEELGWQLVPAGDLREWTDCWRGSSSFSSGTSRTSQTSTSGVGIVQPLRKYIPANRFHKASGLVSGIVPVEGHEKLGYMANGYVLVKQLAEIRRG